MNKFERWIVRNERTINTYLQILGFVILLVGIILSIVFKIVDQAGLYYMAVYFIVSFSAWMLISFIFGRIVSHIVNKYYR